jgi:hypothetical protein
MTALDAIYGEIAMLRLRTDCLEQAAEILGPLYEPANLHPLAREGQRHEAHAARTPKCTSPSLTQLREHIIAHSPINRRELLEAVDGHPTAIDKKVRRLLANGEIAVDGQPGSRVFLAPSSTQQAVPPTSPNPSPSRIPPERGVYPVYDAAVDLGSASTQQLMEHTGLPTSIVVEQGRRLVRIGLLRFTETGGKRVWLPTPTEQSDGAI